MKQKWKAYLGSDDWLRTIASVRNCDSFRFLWEAGALETSWSRLGSFLRVVCTSVARFGSVLAPVGGAGVPILRLGVSICGSGASFWAAVIPSGSFFSKKLPRV